MADRSPNFSKNSVENRKKSKKKTSKRKSSSSSISPKCGDKSNASKGDKYGSLHEKKEFARNNSDDLLTVKRRIDKQPDCHTSKNKIERHSSVDRGKHDKHTHSDFGGNIILNRNLYDGEVYKNHTNNRNNFNKTLTTNSQLLNRTSRSLENTNSLLEKIELLTNEVNFLAQENARLNDSLNEVKYNWSMRSNSDIDVIFKKKHLEEKFSHVLNSLISNLLCGNINAEELSKFCSSVRNETSESSKPPDCLFAVDPSAEPVEYGNAPIPMYEASFNEILESPNDSKNASPKKFAGFAKSCFNCNEDHHMSICPYKLDFRKIAIARKRTRSNFVPSVRYHVQGKNDSDFKPGAISDDLREALGIQKNQIPPYIYTMRILDYPPGWLQEAAVESSGMILYDSEGNALKDHCEDGEVDTSSVRVQYDPDKLIDYPGFNVPLPPDVIDECAELGVPPLQTSQLRCYVEKHMAKPLVRPNRKRKIDLPNHRPSKLQRCEEDMEIEDSEEGLDSNFAEIEFIPPLPESAPPPPPPSPPPPDSETHPEGIEDNNSSLIVSAADHFKLKCFTDFSSGTSSPSLVELEELKKKLVMELGINSDEGLSSNASLDDESSLTPNFSENKNCEMCIVDECGGSDDSNNLSNISDSSSTLNKTSDTASEYSESPVKRTTSSSKCVALGTPSLSSHSPYAKLPDYGQFSKNVSAHIPFENLPNSTGTYEKMKNVLKKVKNKLNSLVT